VFDYSVRDRRENPNLSRRDDSLVAVVCVVLGQPIYIHSMKQMRIFSANFAIMDGRALSFRMHYFLNIFALRITH
jgi:hypothetical protein